VPTTFDAEDRQAKEAVRSRIIRERRSLSDRDRGVAARAFRRHLLARVAELPAGPVALYVSLGGEPDTTLAIEELRAQGCAVWLPVQRTDQGLDWAAFEGWDELHPGPHRIREPSGRRLPIDELRSASLVVIPALAVDHQGRRLGRGAGCYDRTLARLRSSGAIGAPPTCALVYESEVVPVLPAQPHDEPVDEVITPQGYRSFTAGQG
jgi:5-formyltetrahydrofolate cyclo-ligase